MPRLNSLQVDAEKLARLEARVREDVRRELDASWRGKVADAEARAAREKAKG